MDFAPVILAVISAAIYGIIFFAKAWASAPEPKPPFDPYKFGATMVIAIFIGLMVGMSGSSLTEADFLVQISAYAGLVAIVETLLKVFWRSIVPQT